MKTPQYWTVILLMMGTLALVRIRGDVDKVPPSLPLNQMPATIGGMTSTDIPLGDDVLTTLGKGVFLNRVYMPEAPYSPDAAPIGLFIGYFPTQRSGQSIHSPQHCLPGAGWTFDSSGVTELTDSAGQRYRVGEYVISNGKVRQEVLYWYRSHGQSIANDYAAKFYMLLDAIRYSRTDAALVRVITPLRPEETQLAAHRRAVVFAEQMTPLLPAFVPN